MIAIDHGDGITSIYGHLGSIGVREGEVVEAGDRIGAAGATGLTEHPALHFAVWMNGSFIDPTILIPHLHE